MSTQIYTVDGKPVARANPATGIPMLATGRDCCCCDVLIVAPYNHELCIHRCPNPGIEYEWYVPGSIVVSVEWEMPGGDHGSKIVTLVYHRDFGDDCGAYVASSTIKVSPCPAVLTVRGHTCTIGVGDEGIGVFIDDTTGIVRDDTTGVWVTTNVSAICDVSSLCRKNGED